MTRRDIPLPREPVLRQQPRRLTRRTALISAFCALALSACTTSDVLEIPPPQASPSKYAAVVIDASDGRVLYSRMADEQRYPASLTKMMTLYLLFEAIEQGRTSRGSEIPISANAAGKPATKLYMKPGDTILVDTAIRALAVKSANDVATAVAEYLGGSEERFAQMMTQKARILGMKSTRFTNASGLPDSGMVTTARDMALLSIALRRNFPQYYAYFSLRSFEFRGKTIKGHNKVLDMVAGADGLKTGYIRASGYNLAASARRGGKSIVAVVMGGDTGAARDAHMVQLLTAGFTRAGR